MSNHDYIIDNAVGATVRADINSALSAIVTNNSSATEPSTMYAYQWWADTTTGLMKQRNAANTAWLTKFVLSEGQLALLDGSASQVFSVGTATAAAHAVRLDQVSLMPTVASAATLDVFGSAGATLSVSGTTTITGITACADGQVGSKKTVIPSNAAGFSFTASANMKVDGATSGTYLMPQNAIVEVFASSTTTFEVRTVWAEISWTPYYELATPGTSSFGTYAVQLGKATKIGNRVAADVFITGGTFSLGTGSGTLAVKGFPFAANATIAGSGVVNFSSAYVTLAPETVRFAASTSETSFRNISGATVSAITSAHCASSLRTEFTVEYFV